MARVTVRRAARVSGVLCPHDLPREDVSPRRAAWPHTRYAERSRRRRSSWVPGFGARALTAPLLLALSFPRVCMDDRVDLVFFVPPSLPALGVQRRSSA